MSESAVISDRRLEREAAKRSRERRGQAVAAISTVLVIGGLAVWILTSPGWPVVRETFFSWTIFKDSFPEVLEGFWLDVKLFMIVEVVVLVAGLAIALVRTSRAPALFPLRLLGTVYVDLFRGFPTIILIVLVGFGVPALRLQGLPTDPLVLGGIALALSYSAYVAEVYRAGIASVHRGQRDAALAVGLSDRQATRHVILPQAVRRVAPPLLNDLVSLQKDTALIAALGTPYYDAVLQAQIDTTTTYNYTPYVIAGLLVLVLTIPMTRFTDWIARRQGWTTAGATV
ncbi:MAG: polar amino acid transport system permease protein [Solirubrobacterales bacterium]|nr:polar amino acid transport system permease protein [Solirubrobacterales bacterium]